MEIYQTEPFPKSDTSPLTVTLLLPLAVKVRKR